MAYKKEIDDLRRPSSSCCGSAVPTFPTTIPIIPFTGAAALTTIRCAPLDDLAQYDYVLLVTGHSSCDYARIGQEAQLVIDSRNAMSGIRAANIDCC